MTSSKSKSDEPYSEFLATIKLVSGEEILSKVITLSEIKDEMVLDTYQSIVSSGFKRTHPDLNRKMGYINSVEKSRSIIEKLYNDDDASKEPKKD